MTEENAVEATPTADAVAPEAPANQLQEILDAHQIREPQDLTGLIEDLGKFKRDYGSSQNEVGDLRRQVTALQEQLQETQNRSNASLEDDYIGQPVDLKGEIRDAISEYAQEQGKIQLEARQRYTQERALVESMPNWKNVQSLYDAAIMNPQVQQAIGSGLITQENLYHRINEQVILGIANAANNQIKNLPEGSRLNGQTPINTPPGGGNVNEPMSSNDERWEYLQNAKKTNDVDGVLRALIPDNDPILR